MLSEIMLLTFRGKKPANETLNLEKYQVRKLPPVVLCQYVNITKQTNQRVYLQNVLVSKYRTVERQDVKYGNKDMHMTFVFTCSCNDCKK